MPRQRQGSPRATEDLALRRVSGPPDYARRTAGPVRYLEVVDGRDGAVIGYVWANDQDDAAGWLVRAGVDDVAHNQGARWIGELRAAKARGMTPTQALAALMETADPAGSAAAGGVDPRSLAEAAALDDLRRLAAQART